MKPFRFGIAIAATEPPDALMGNLKLAEELIIWHRALRRFGLLRRSLCRTAQG